MSCSWTVGILTGGAGCVIEHIAGSAASSVASSATQSMATDFTNSFSSMLNAFGTAFVDIPGLDFAGSGLAQMYGISLGIAATIAILMLFYQTVQTVITHSGESLAQALVGFAKGVLACVLVLSVGDTLENLTDALAKWIVHMGFNPNGAGTSDGTQFASVMNKALGADLGTVNGASNYAAFMIIVGIIGCIVVAVLWIEMIMRNAGLAVLVATAPISAFGQMSKGTSAWWGKTVRGVLQLMILKPMIAFIFVLGLAVGGEDTGGITQVITGLMILGVAVIAWPALGKFMVFTESQAAASGGVGALLGFAAGRASTAGGGFPAGADANIAGGGGGADAAGGGGGAGGAAARAARMAAGVGTGGTATAVAAVARAAAAAGQSMTSHMSQMGGHAGLGQGERIGGGPHYMSYGRSGRGQSAPAQSGTPQQPGQVQGPAAAGLDQTVEIPLPGHGRPHDPHAETQSIDLPPLPPQPEPGVPETPTSGDEA